MEPYERVPLTSPFPSVPLYLQQSTFLVVPTGLLDLKRGSVVSRIEHVRGEIRG